MKILLLADIHSNWPALRAIHESFDTCVFLGDAVDYATQPVECIDWIQQHARWCVRGNHDHAVAQRVSLTPGGTFRQIAGAMRAHHLSVLSDEYLTWLAELPVTQHAILDNHSFYFVHATPRDPMDEYVAIGNDGDKEDSLGELTRQWKARLNHLEADFVCVGHTHIPMDLQLENCRVINPGSVGQPRDGDPRASYAVIEDGQVHFRRVEYDVDETIAHLRKSGIDSRFVKKTETILRSGGNPSRWPE